MNKSIDSHLDISVIIVNYRSWKHLKNCLNSLKDIHQDAFTFEVIIVDNNSNDNTLDSFSKNFPEFRFINNSGNNGFSNGNNLGARHANGEFFLFLNPDTIVTKSAIETVFKIAKTHLDYGIISCTQLNMKGKAEKEIRFFPELTTLFGITRALYKIVNKTKISSKYEPTKDVIFPDWVSGSLIFISKSWFNKINRWCEDYWLYFEDVDICKRVHNAGGKIALIRTTNIIHNHGGSSRINIKTAALTKAEVIISKHVYINNHFNGVSKIVTHLLLFLIVFISKLLLGIVGTILFFIPKLHVHLFLFINLTNYYCHVLINKTWLSKKAPNYAL